jgi:hypothetical protein
VNRHERRSPQKPPPRPLDVLAARRREPKRVFTPSEAEAHPTSTTATRRALAPEPRWVDTSAVWDSSVPPRKYRRARAKELNMKIKARYGPKPDNEPVFGGKIY